MSKMYQCPEICLPRKKKVRESFHSNTYRIFDEKIPDRLDPDKVYKVNSYAQRDPKEYDQLKIHNTPQMYNAKFIRTNVRFMNAPISHMETESTMAEQCHWWPNTSYHDVSTQAPYRKDSTQRQDYQAIQQTHTLVRHGRNNNRVPASGIATWSFSVERGWTMVSCRGEHIHQLRGVMFASGAGRKGGKEVTSPQQQVFNDGRIHSGKAGPSTKGTKAIACHSPTHPSSQLFHSFYTPMTHRGGVEGGFEGISSVSDRAAEGRRAMHADGEGTVLQRQGSNSQQAEVQAPAQIAGSEPNN